ncbi:MAG: UbiA family prenyltransferase [Erythrobacter sp.]
MRETDLRANDAVLVVEIGDLLVAPVSGLELFWTAVSANAWQVLARLARAPASRTSLAAGLEEIAHSAPSSLHYRETVLESARSWREAGGRVVLVSPGKDDAARAIAAHLGIFDAVENDVDAATQDEKLRRLFGPAGWSRLAPADVAPRVAEIAPAPAAYAATLPSNTGKEALRLIRPHQWLKNALIFVPMLAAHQLTLGAIWHSLLAFVAFSLIASSTYVLNDLLDLNADRAHPRKRNRPLASGAVSLAQGTLLVPLLALAGIGAALLSGPMLLGALMVYFVLTTAYSVKFKRLVVVDICMLAVLYTMRILAGSAATGIATSMWLLAFSTFFFFSLAAIKRQAELVDGAAAGREKAHGRGYLTGDLAIVSNIAVSGGLISVLVLALYVNSQPVQLLYHTPEMLWGVCLVLLFWNTRIAILTQRGEMHDDPLVFAARDKVSLVCAALIGALALAGMQL